MSHCDLVEFEVCFFQILKNCLNSGILKNYEFWPVCALGQPNFLQIHYRVTRRVFSEPVTSKLHLLYTKNLAGQLKTPKVIRISAMHANFSHSPVHSGPICFHMTKNLKLPSGTNKTK